MKPRSQWLAEHRAAHERFLMRGVQKTASPEQVKRATDLAERRRALEERREIRAATEDY